MTVHQNNLENSMSTVIPDKSYCIVATISDDIVDVSPLTIPDIVMPTDEVLIDETYCIVTTISHNFVTVLPLVVPNKIDQIADALVDKGYYITHDLLPEMMTASLYQRVTQLNTEDFNEASIGRHQELQLNQQIRSDKTRWLTNDNDIDISYLNWMTHLRLELNQRLYMGLFKYEAHYAYYAPNAYYQRHVDAFKGKSNRVLTTLLYLNPDWQTADGGQLLIYHPETDEIIEEIKPEYGKFVVFLSDQFPHQVLKANRDRYSISGWFHINNLP